MSEFAARPGVLPGAAVGGPAQSAAGTIGGRIRDRYQAAQAKKRPSGLFGDHELGGIITQCGGTVDQPPQFGLAGGRGAGEDPEIAARGIAHDRPAIIRRMIQHPVIADIEGAEEADLQLGIL